MRIRWYGQSAFLLRADDGAAIFIDPFGDLSAAGRDFRFGYAPISDVEADLLLITHEHLDHNAAERVGGSPQVIRSTAGRFESRFGEVVAVASEHDAVAGTQRGPNTIFVLHCDGLTVCHFGDFGQAALRPEQQAAIGQVDVLVLPVGGGPTTGGPAAAAIVEALSPRLVVPMHYRTEAIDFLEPPDAFIEALAGWRADRLGEAEFTVELTEQPRIVLPAAPLAA